jgi:radical SAM superfamily enzyme YgiQ (UPF0313 family)
MNKALLFNSHSMIYNRPGGIHRIATVLREEGWDVECLDWAAFFHLEELKEYAKQRITSETVFCGFGCFFNFWNGYMEEFVAWLKLNYPHVKIMTGVVTKPLISGPNIDYCIYGFGERALLAVVASLLGNTPPGGIKYDPAYFGSKTKIINANDYYPAFPMKSLMIKYEDRDYIQSDEWLSLEFGRGCIFECLYCNFPVLGVKEDHSRDADDFVLQLKDAYDRFGVTQYYVADETINDRTEKLAKFSEVVDQLPFRPLMSGFIRADLLVSRKQDWPHLSKLGILGHFYGIETFNHQTGKMIGKGMNPTKLQDGLLKAKEYFKTQDSELYRGLIALVIGLPHETKKSLAETAQWIEKNWQGESVDYSPLEIPIDSDTNKLAKLGKDWQGWGYEKLEEPLWEPAGSPAYNRGYGRKNLIWKTKEMDVNWARQWAHDTHSSPNTPTGLNVWSLHIASQCGFPREQAFNMTNTTLLDTLVPVVGISRLLKYKSKKLNVSIESLNQLLPDIDWYDNLK